MSNDVSDTDGFDEHLERWRSWASTPWGRIRFAVVRRTLSWQVAALGGGPLRVLDVGGGDARDSLPLAQRGHSVTVLDSAPGMLREARSAAGRLGIAGELRLVEGSLDDLETSVGGGFDLVLCHFLMQYRPAGLTDLRRLSAALRTGGRLSLAAPNPAGVVLGRLVREGPAAALAELDRPAGETLTFQQAVRKIHYEDMRRDLAEVGLDVVAHYGGRCANDLLVDDSPKYDPSYFAHLERLEMALCDREPFIRTAQFWQLVAAKPAGPTEAAPSAE